MFNKQNLVSIIYKLKCRVKSIGKILFVQICIVNIIFPILGIYAFLQEELLVEWTEKIKIFISMIFPIVSICCVTFSMKEYIEGDGSEIIYVYNRKTLVLENILLFMISLMNIIIVCVLWGILLPKLKLFLIWIPIICFFCFCLVNFVYFLSNSIVFTTMCILLYSFFNLFFKSNTPVAFLYSSALGYNFSDEFYVVYLPMLVVGIILLCFSTYINLYKRSFK